MNQENNTFDNLHSSQDNVQIGIEGSTSAATMTYTYSSANLTISSTIIDKLNKDLQYDTVKFLLCSK
jgi:hypothetical protein